MLKDAIKDIIVPKTDRLVEQLADLSEKWADCAMLAHTHGQPASPTTIGKEYSNFTYRLALQSKRLKDTQIHGKFNGAVGNYNAHYFVFPELDWK